MTLTSAPPLREKLRQIGALLASAKASALSREQLQDVERLINAFPIEVAETRASPKQLAFQRVFFDRSNAAGRRLDVFTALGGNRSGKSYVCGWLCFAKYLRDQARDGDWFWCVGQTLDRSIGGQQRELWRALPRWMFGEQRWDEKLGFGQHRKVVLPTTDGGRCLVEFRSADQDPSTFEQAKLTGAWCDERLPEAVYDRLLPRIVDRSGWILYSDIPEQWWQYARLKEAKPEAGVYFEHFTMHDNAANLPDGAIDRTAAKMTADEQRQRIAGEFVVLEGVVYREYSDTVHAIDPFAIPPDWPRWRAIDYGASAPTACIWVTISPNETIYVYREHYERGRSVGDNAKLIIEASGGERYAKTYIDPHAFDRSPANEVTVADQYKRAGIACIPWPYVNVMGEHAMVQRVKFRLENRQLKVFKPCVNLRREFRSWKYKTDREGRPLTSDAFENDNNHALDALKGLNASNPTHQQPKIQVFEYVKNWRGEEEERPARHVGA